MVLCLRCNRGINEHGIRVHTRQCFGLRMCLICDLPFPCTNERCPWLFPKPPRVPKELVPYFYVRDPRWGWLKKRPPELELRALRWLASLKRKAWSRTSVR